MTKTNGVFNSSNLLLGLGLTIGVLSAVSPALAEDAPPAADPGQVTIESSSTTEAKPAKAKKAKKEKKDGKGWNGDWPKKGDDPAGKATPEQATINRENGEEPEIKTDADKRPATKEVKKDDKTALDPNRPFNPDAIREYNQGVELQQKDQLNQAILKYKAAIEADERLERAWCNLGLIYTSQRNFSKANDAFKKALALKPNNPFSLNGMGSVFYSKGKLQEAMERWKKAIEVDPNFFSVYFNMANAWKNERDYDKALENYVMTIKTNSQMAEPFYEIGSIFAKQKHTAQAQAMLTRAIQLNPEGEFVFDAKKQLSTLEGLMGKEEGDGEVKMSIVAPPANPDESSK